VLSPNWLGLKAAHPGCEKDLVEADAEGGADAEGEADAKGEAEAEGEAEAKGLGAPNWNAEEGGAKAEAEAETETESVRPVDAEPKGFGRTGLSSPIDPPLIFVPLLAMYRSQIDVQKRLLGLSGEISRAAGQSPEDQVDLP